MPVKGHGTVHEPIGSVSDFEDLVHLLPQLRFTLDVGHCLQNGDDFDLFIRKYSSRIQNIHLHDGIARGNAHLRLGDGSLNLSQLLETLHNIHFDRYVSLETISPEDTLSSWRILRESEASNRLLDEDGTPSLGQLRPISRGVHL
jgi:sugar phosphate isomerase/epimerase